MLAFIVALETVTWQTILVAYGPLGVIAFFYIRNNESRYRDQRDRGDRLENELGALNRTLRDTVLANLTRATEAASVAVARRRDR